MIVVRYATLVTLVIWLGAMAAEQFGDLLHRVALVPFACGGVMLVGLFVLKFMGPPPMAFVWRAGLALLMLAIALAAWVAPPESSMLLKRANIGLGLVLLIWYVRE